MLQSECVCRKERAMQSVSKPNKINVWSNNDQLDTIAVKIQMNDAAPRVKE